MTTEPKTDGRACCACANTAGPLLPVDSAGTYAHETCIDGVLRLRRDNILAELRKTLDPVPVHESVHDDSLVRYADSDHPRGHLDAIVGQDAEIEQAADGSLSVWFVPCCDRERDWDYTADYMGQELGADVPEDFVRHLFRQGDLRFRPDRCYIVTCDLEEAWSAWIRTASCP